ncbi:NAD(P)-binding protein, partial [Myxococcota bacterium]|nr:NAD(P)-binding protein [Myxococcota bacterium]
MEHCQHLVIGGGVSGLSFTLATPGDCILLERSDTPGGLSATRVERGYGFDFTGHWLHLADSKLAEKAKDLVEMVEIERRARVYFKGRYLPYPFQLHLA